VHIQVSDGDPIELGPVHSDGGLPALLYPSSAEIRGRFLQRTEPLLGKRAEHVAHLVDTLDRLADVRELTHALRPAGTG
jgi:hypothetical protein